MHWDNRVNNTNIRDTTALGLCILALTQPLWSVCAHACVCARTLRLSFFFHSFFFFFCVYMHVQMSCSAVWKQIYLRLQHHSGSLVRRHLMADAAVWWQRNYPNTPNHYLYLTQLMFTHSIAHKHTHTHMHTRIHRCTKTCKHICLLMHTQKHHLRIQNSQETKKWREKTDSIQHASKQAKEKASFYNKGNGQ